MHFHTWTATQWLVNLDLFLAAVFCGLVALTASLVLIGRVLNMLETPSRPPGERPQGDIDAS